jgi:toxin ParE1/3/4
VIRFRRAAARELAADFRYYEKDYPGRGRRFVDAVDAALARIAEAPAQFAILFEPDIRSAKVLRFPYRVVYLVLNSDIEVLAVAHAKRRPGYWRRRTKSIV